MKVNLFRSVIALTIALFFVYTLTSIAMAVSGSWFQNSVSMSGYVVHSKWIEPLKREIKGRSSASSSQHPQNLVQVITISIAFKDRCYPPTLTWRLNASNGKSASWATTTGDVYASGPYQNCVTGHQYLKQSTHVFVNNSTGLNTTKNLSEQN